MRSLKSAVRCFGLFPPCHFACQVFHEDATHWRFNYNR